MRISVDLIEEQISSLNKLGEVRGLSRAEMIRRAVGDYLNKNKQYLESNTDQAFDILKHKPIDGLHLQDNLRDEWQNK